MVQWTDLPPDIATILRATKHNGHTKAVNIFFREDGTVMVSAQRASDTSAWNIAHNTDPLMALVEALGPGYGGSWQEHLKPAASVRRKVVKEKMVNTPPNESDDDDWMSVV
jgi:hypothetical protein